MTIPHTIDAILEELAAARSKREDAMAQGSIEHRAAGDRKQVARPGRAS